MTAWHLDDDALRRYVERTDSLAEGASAEQHLMACEPCRARVNTTVTAAASRVEHSTVEHSTVEHSTVERSVTELSMTERSVIDFAAVWERTRDAIEVPRPSVFERLLRGAGLPAQEARLVAVASAFRGVWLTGVVAVLAFAALAAAVGHARGMWLFLSVAPVVPCLVVASSYDPWMDPALEPELVTPYPMLRLILLRTIAVLALALPAVLVSGLFIPGETAFAWLLPAVGFVAVVLAASTWFSPLRSAVVVSSGWLAVIWLLAFRISSPDAVLQAPAQAAFLALAAASFSVFLVRRRRLHQLRPWR
ncbi:MAG TPA: hypothetical protein VHY31_01955 [Streptosporangiaceae bacterium]|jgi:hypothetical protein|nr:hypothetical protein [Streptosporangiaceae bacterium]